MKRILELFSGTGSVGRAFGERGWEVTSLDVDPTRNPTICEDILTWDYKQFKPGHFDVIWASPVCTHYSVARTKAKTPRDLDWADSLVKATLRIIRYLQPRFWFIENPATGMLKDRVFMQGLAYTDVDYCRYCDWGYRKRTRLWTNSGFEGKLCEGQGACRNMVGARHRSSAQQGRNKYKDGLHGLRHLQGELYRIPDDLCEEIVEQVS